MGGRVAKGDSDFRLFGLDIETNPPKTVYSVVTEGREKGKRAGIYYWRFDIDNLCIAQKGLSLSALQKIWADEMALDEKRRLDWKCQRINGVIAALADAVWEIWSRDAKYRYARETFAADVTKEKLQWWLCLTARHSSAHWPRFLNNEFAQATTEAAFARMDQAWVRDMATRLLTHLRNFAEYADRCNYWHKNRIETELERAHKLDESSICNTCHICHDSLEGSGVDSFLCHMGDSHEEFWVDGSWTIF